MRIITLKKRTPTTSATGVDVETVSDLGEIYARVSPVQTDIPGVDGGRIPVNGITVYCTLPPSVLASDVHLIEFSSIQYDVLSYSFFARESSDETVEFTCTERK